jgi:4-hydroxy-4-methyl-2-oxoglutarate aldolase
MDEQTNAQHGLSVEQIHAATLALLTSPIVSDSLDAVGLRHQVLDRGLVPLDPGARAIGRAHTIQFAPTELDVVDPYAEAMSFIDGLRPGSLAVIATGRDDRTAYWGELFSAAAIGRGAVGTICDGPVRDTPKVRALGYPVFAAGTRPIDFRARMRVVATSQPVRCAGVVIAEGDLVVADADGIVVVPAAFEGSVLERAVARATAESTVLTELLAGASLREVWERWHVL